MKAITLFQPWATLVVIGAKRIETRSWPTKYRGPLAIHSSKNRRFVNFKSIDYICARRPFYEILTASFGKWVGGTEWANFMPLGSIIGTCDLAECREIKEGPLLISDQEKSFGDYALGRYMWMLDKIKKLKMPIPIRGAMGLWEWSGNFGKES